MLMGRKSSLSKGMTGFQLKIVALVFMLLDHIQYFFEFKGGVSLAFSWIGRLSANLFLFMLIEGFTHTSNRIKYFIQITPSLQRGDGFYPKNGVFATLVVLLIIFQGIDWIRKGRFAKGIVFIPIPFIINVIFIFSPQSI